MPIRKMSKEERKDMRATIEANIHDMEVRLQCAIVPHGRIEQATQAIRLCQEIIDKHLRHIDQIATDQVQIVELRHKLMAEYMVLQSLSTTNTVSEVKAYRKRAKRAISGLHAKRAQKGK